jgi:hypothetical protein
MMLKIPPIKCETPLASGVTRKRLTERDDSIALGFRQAEAAMRQLQARGILLSSVFVIAFDKSRATLVRERATAQVIPLPGLRPCAQCGVFVGNLNLGGYDGRSAMTGKLFCLKCADQNVLEREAGEHP